MSVLLVRDNEALTFSQTIRCLLRESRSGNECIYNFRRSPLPTPNILYDLGC